ncbi:hypothetical protein IFM51744_10362 [Aspergillus udagawae]|nr:hypothetical protein IFM51744_10362 [Aspergillus udagawae]
MLFNKLTFYSLLAAFAASPAVCLADAEEAVAKMDMFASSLREATHALTTYGDGETTGYSVAKTFDTAQRAGKNANQMLKEAGPLSEPDAHRVVDAYNQLQPEGLRLLKTVSDKAPSMRGRLGVGYIARGIVGGFRADQKDLHDILRKNLPEEQRETLSPNMATVDSAFEDTMKAMDS